MTDVKVTRHDLRPLVRGLVQNIVDKGEENTRRIEAQDQLWKYEAQECLWYRSERIQEDPPRYRAEIIAGLPPTIFDVTVYASDERHIEPELRMKFAHEVMARKFVRDWDEARQRASQAKFLCGERAK